MLLKRKTTMPVEAQWYDSAEFAEEYEYLETARQERMWLSALRPPEDGPIPVNETPYEIALADMDRVEKSWIETHTAGYVPPATNTVDDLDWYRSPAAHPTAPPRNVAYENAMKLLHTPLPHLSSVEGPSL